MSNATAQQSGERCRLRVRFRKEGLLRWIGHHDLMRTFERLARRAALPLSMSEGFHPKPRIRFPSALSLGIEGHNEVVEFDLSRPVSAAHVEQALSAQAPVGLGIGKVELLAPGTGKARVRTTTYRFAVPAERQSAVARAAEQLEKQTTLTVTRRGRKQAEPLPLNLEYVVLDGDQLEFCLRETHRAAARPRDILQALGLDDLEQEGRYLQRTAVELVT